MFKILVFVLVFLLFNLILLFFFNAFNFIVWLFLFKNVLNWGNFKCVWVSLRVFFSLFNCFVLVCKKGFVNVWVEIFFKSVFLKCKNFRVLFFRVIFNFFSFKVFKWCLFLKFNCFKEVVKCFKCVFFWWSKVLKEWCNFILNLLSFCNYLLLLGSKIFIVFEGVEVFKFVIKLFNKKLFLCLIVDMLKVLVKCNVLVIFLLLKEYKSFMFFLFLVIIIVLKVFFVLWKLFV